MNLRQQFRAARRHLRAEPSLFNPMPVGIPSVIWDAAKATMFKPVKKREWTGRGDWRTGSREVIEWQKFGPNMTYGCRCDACIFTNRHARAGFSKWPSDAPKGKRKSDAEYRAHVAHLWEGVAKSVPFKPGQPAQYPHQPGLVPPITPLPSWIREKLCAKPLPSPNVFPGPDVKPVKAKRVPPLLALARELRKAA